jgi:calcineurin-like phosphoesterase
MRVLFISDIVGAPGREIVRERLADLVSNKQIDLVIANGENSAAGFGITPRIAEELFGYGIEVLTGGNHSWDKKEIMEFMPHEPRLLRPANFPEGTPGSGMHDGTARNGVKYTVINVHERGFFGVRM